MERYTRTSPRSAIARVHPPAPTPPPSRAASTLVAVASYPTSPRLNGLRNVFVPVTSDASKSNDDDAPERSRWYSDAAFERSPVVTTATPAAPPAANVGRYSALGRATLRGMWPASDASGTREVKYRRSHTKTRWSLVADVQKTFSATDDPTPGPPAAAAAHSRKFTATPPCAPSRVAAAARRARTSITHTRPSLPQVANSASSPPSPQEDRVGHMRHRAHFTTPTCASSIRRSTTKTPDGFVFVFVETSSETVPKSSAKRETHVAPSLEEVKIPPPRDQCMEKIPPSCARSSRKSSSGKPLSRPTRLVSHSATVPSIPPALNTRNARSPTSFVRGAN